MPSEGVERDELDAVLPKITVALFGTTWPCLNSARPSLTTRSAFPSPFTSPGAAAIVPRLGAFGSAWILNPRPPIDPRSTWVGTGLTEDEIRRVELEPDRDVRPSVAVEVTYPGDRPARFLRPVPLIR